MKRTIIAIILLSAFSCCLGSNRFEVYRNKNIKAAYSPEKGGYNFISPDPFIRFFLFQ